jgi:uncharacterized membrane-anchored protein YhcB (DUF1043 family)
MAEKPQFYQEVQWANKIDVREQKLKTNVTQLEGIKTELDAIKAEVDADTGATADMITLANQASSLVNHVNYTTFISWMHTSLDF